MLKRKIATIWQAAQVGACNLALLGMPGLAKSGRCLLADVLVDTTVFARSVVLLKVVVTDVDVTVEVDEVVVVVVEVEVEVVEVTVVLVTVEVVTVDVVVVVVVVCAGSTAMPDGESSPEEMTSSTFPPLRSARWILRVAVSVQYSLRSFSSMATSVGLLRPVLTMVSTLPP